VTGRDQPDRPAWEDDTVPTPRVRVDRSSPPPARSSSDTLEMPAVRGATPAPGGTAPPRPERPAGAGRAAAPSRPAPGSPRRRSRTTRAAVLVGALVVAAGLGVLAGRLVPPAAEDPPLAVASGAGDAVDAVDATWTSVDPVGGSGFRQVDAQTWRTQSYRTAEFGNLKSGVGLLADLGSPREIEAVTVDVAPVGAVVELRAGDSASQDPEDYVVVDRTGDAAGPTTLEAADAGAHRYWLLWVPQLGPREGGYVAELSAPDVEA
jgi:hypothetical protein